MKNITSIALAGALTMVTAQAAVSNVAGYNTHTIYAAFGPGSPKNNVLAPELENAATFTSTIDSINVDQLVLTGAAFAGGEFDAGTKVYGINYTYYVETADGYWAQIVSNDATSIIVEAGAGANFTAAETVTIRKHVTIAEYFGPNNETGMLSDNVGSVSSADNITLIDEVNGGTITVFPSSVIPGSTYLTTSFEEGGDVSIYPDQGLQVLRRGATDLSVVHEGIVDENGRQIGISTGVQIRPINVPVPTSLDYLGLHTGDPATGLVGSATASIGEADGLSVLVNGSPTNYFYSTIDLGSGPGWYTSGFAPAGDLPVGAGLIINRNNPTNSSPFIWMNPGATVAP